MLRQCPPNAVNEELEQSFWNLVKQIVVAERWLRLLDTVRAQVEVQHTSLNVTRKFSSKPADGSKSL